MVPQFIRIGNRVINLCLVTDVELETTRSTGNYDSEPCVRLHLAANSIHEWYDGPATTTNRKLDFVGDDAAALRRFFGDTTFVRDIT